MYKEYVLCVKYLKKSSSKTLNGVGWTENIIRVESVCVSCYDPKRSVIVTGFNRKI